MNEKVLMVLLAADVADCSVSPPMLPTQCAIMRCLYLLGECRRRDLLRLIPCGVDTVGQQLCRLVASGLARRRYEKVGGRSLSVYSLSPGGRIMVQQWGRKVDAALREINVVLQGMAKEGGDA